MSQRVIRPYLPNNSSNSLGLQSYANLPTKSEAVPAAFSVVDTVISRPALAEGLASRRGERGERGEREARVDLGLSVISI